MLNKRLFFISIILLLIVSIGAVSASDTLLDDNVFNEDSGNENIILSGDSDDGTDDYGSNGESTDSNSNSDFTENDNSEDSDQSGEIIKPSGDSFEDVQNAILSSKENGIVKLNGTYHSTGNYIYINKNLTIEGENAVLDAKGLSGIIVSEKAIILKNIIFKNSDKNEAVHIEGNATFINCIFESNKYMAIKCVSDQKSDTVNINGCNFKGNYIVLDFNGGNLNIESSTFSSNKVNSWSDSIFKIFDTKNLPSKVSISNSSFVSNIANEEIFYFELNNSASSNIINNCTFNKNKVEDNAVIYLYKGVLTIKNSIFGNNTRVISTDAPNEYFKNNKLNIQNSTFDGNKKFVLDNNANGSISSCTFKNNNALIFNYDLLTIKNSKFINNKASIKQWGYKTLSIINSTFTNSSDDVTCIFSSSGILKVKDSTFKCNSEAAVISLNKITITKGNKTSTYKKVLSFNNALKPFSYVNFTLNKLTTSYKSGKTFKIKAVFGNSKKACSNVTFVMEVYKGNHYVDQFRATTNSKGIAYFKISRLGVGSYNALIGCSKYKSYYDTEFISAKSSIKINKANTVVSAPKVKYRYKKTKYFKVTVKNKASKKAVSGIKVKIKVYTGKKYKTYTVKTNKKGVAKLNTKNLKRGKHNVVISSGNKNYIISKKSTITIN